MADTDLEVALLRAKMWMRSNGAEVLVDNLAPGAPATMISAVERRFGFPVPAELRALWSLHDGQKEEQNGFVEFRDLFGTELALVEHDNMRERYIDGDYGVLAAPVHPEEWSEVGLRPEEISDRWIAFAGRDSDYLLVNADTGRVFSATKDVPPLTLESESIAAWFLAYADAMTAGEYDVEEGFGDCYLSKDD